MPYAKLIIKVAIIFMLVTTGTIAVHDGIDNMINSYIDALEFDHIEKPVMGDDCDEEAETTESCSGCMEDREILLA